MDCIYEGQIHQKGYPHGWGVFINNHGDFYMGWWQNGNYHGNGIKSIQNEKMEQGYFENGQRISYYNLDDS